METQIIIVNKLFIKNSEDIRRYIKLPPSHIRGEIFIRLTCKHTFFTIASSMMVELSISELCVYNNDIKMWN